MPDASYRNNADKSSQRAHVIFIAEDRKIGRQGQKGEHKVHTRGSVVDYESHKITTTTPINYSCRTQCTYEVLRNLFVYSCFMG